MISIEFFGSPGSGKTTIRNFLAKEFEKMSYNYNGGTWGGGPHDSFLFKFAKQKVKFAL